MSRSPSSAAEQRLAELPFVDPQLRLRMARVDASEPRPWPERRSSLERRLAELRVAARGRMLSIAELTEMTRGTSLLVVHEGALVHEWYAPGLGASTAFLGASMTKSVLSVLVGQAVDAGVLGVDDWVGDLVPAVGEGGYGRVSVRHLLTMTTGTAWVEDYRDPDSPAARLLACFAGDRTERGSRRLLAELPGQEQPSSRYAYCTADSQMLDWVREVATGEPFAVALQRLWRELGAEHPAHVLNDDDGVAFAGGGLAASARDWARVGELLLTGECGGARLSASWRRRCRVPSYVHTGVGRLPETITSHAGFSYHWWPLRDDGLRVTADGSRGQFTYVDFERAAVVVKTSQWGYDDPFADRGHRDACYLALPEIAATTEGVLP